LENNHATHTERAKLGLLSVWWSPEGWSHEGGCWFFQTLWTCSFPQLHTLGGVLGAGEPTLVVSPVDKEVCWENATPEVALRSSSHRWSCWTLGILVAQLQMDGSNLAG
jgi:hypothetical protein